MLRPIVLHVLYAMWNELPEEDRAKVWKEKRNKWTIASKDLKERWKIDLAPEDIKKHAVSYLILSAP